MACICQGEITTHHSPAPDRVTSREPATPLGDGRRTDRDGRPAQPEGRGVALGKERMGMSGGGLLGGGLPDVATVRD